MIKIRLKGLHLAVIAVGLFVGVAALYVYFPASTCTGNYRLLNPALSCGARDAISKVSYRTFRERLESDIEQMKQEGNVQTAAVYFRDLERGPTFGIDERTKFIPASLLKVPLLITYFRLAEDDPAILKRNLLMSASSTYEPREQGLPPQQSIEKEKAYAVEDLLFRMIAYSDNRSYALLWNDIESMSTEYSLVNETLSELGLTNPENDIAEETFSVKSYAFLFRVLYNASYLTTELSEKSLEYLSATEYAEGLRKGVPLAVPIAHKFGIRELPSGERQLHDCGIVYYPDNPYLLCVMTRGDDFQELAGVITYLSKAVYEEVDARRY